jgi:hypothetical protein
MAFIECSETFCTAAFWESKYRALRAAFLEWRQIERTRRKYLQKNLQKLTVWTHEVHQGTPESIWKIKNLLFEMRHEAEE